MCNTEAEHNSKTHNFMVIKKQYCGFPYWRNVPSSLIHRIASFILYKRQSLKNCVKSCKVSKKYKRPFLKGISKSEWWQARPEFSAYIPI
jgi:hypothetical protein